jgi:soluble lytic murein transglycosylase-like protein
VRALALVLGASAPGAGRAQVFEVEGGALRRVDTVVVAPRPVAAPASAETAARRHALAPDLVDAVARQESGYRANAVSRVGALGVMQLMPATARSLGVDPHDPAANLDGGAAYLRAQMDRFGGRIDLALAAYNAGPGAVLRYAGVPPYRETQAYVAASLERLAQRSLALPPIDLGSLP